MFGFKKFAVAAILATALVTSAVAKDDLSPADSKAMHDYSLSMDKIKGMQGAVDDFKMASPAMKQQQKAIGDSSKSIAEMITKVNAAPQIMAIYRKHGLNANDAVLMPFVLMYAGMCVQYPSAASSLAQQTSPAQIAFYKAHQAELQKLNFLSGK
ncbi:MAG TPA: hypothetical protein VGG48_15530 [Rhizomicrobium sp.]|jgi:hypothetical protein